MGRLVALQAADGSSASPDGSLRDVSVVVVTRNRPALFSDCVKSLSDWASGAEVTIVDDNSSPEYVGKSHPPHAKSYRNAERKFLNESRNIGASHSTGRYLFFIDDDNVIERDTVGLLARTLESTPSVGVVAPVALNRDRRVWYAGGRMSRVSCYTFFDYRGAAPDALPPGVYRTGLFHNCFMIRADLFHRLGGFDSAHFPMYMGETDAAERIRSLGHIIAVNMESRVIHNMETDEMRGLVRNIHITEPRRAYFVGRNRILFMRMHRTAPEFVVFLLVWQPAYAAVHLLTIAMSKIAGQSRLNLILSYVRGLHDGISGRYLLGATRHETSI